MQGLSPFAQGSVPIRSDFRTRLPRPGYWPFYAWSKLSALGTQVKTIVPGEAEDPAKRQMQCVAAKGKNGGKALLVARYSDTEDGYFPMPVRVKFLGGGSAAGARLHVSDEVRRHSECGYSTDAEGFISFKLLPNSFALLEIP